MRRSRLGSGSVDGLNVWGETEMMRARTVTRVCFVALRPVMAARGVMLRSSGAGGGKGRLGWRIGGNGDGGGDVRGEGSSFDAWGPLCDENTLLTKRVDLLGVVAEILNRGALRINGDAAAALRFGVCGENTRALPRFCGEERRFSSISRNGGCSVFLFFLNGLFMSNSSSALPPSGDPNSASGTG